MPFDLLFLLLSIYLFSLIFLIFLINCLPPLLILAYVTHLAGVFAPKRAWGTLLGGKKHMRHVNRQKKSLVERDFRTEAFWLEATLVVPIVGM